MTMTKHYCLHKGSSLLGCDTHRASSFQQMYLMWDFGCLSCTVLGMLTQWHGVNPEDKSSATLLWEAHISYCFILSRMTNYSWTCKHLLEVQLACGLHRYMHYTNPSWRVQWTHCTEHSQIQYFHTTYNKKHYITMK